MDFFFAYFGSGYIAWFTGELISRQYFKRDWASASMAGMTGGFGNAILLGIPVISLWPDY
tara:strand:+ start:3159 stop:3338 length:180 start_codon:yes stop_codon:yes gene_type:complete